MRTLEEKIQRIKLIVKLKNEIQADYIKAKSAHETNLLAERSVACNFRIKDIQWTMEHPSPIQNKTPEELKEEREKFNAQTQMGQVYDFITDKGEVKQVTINRKAWNFDNQRNYTEFREFEGHYPIDNLVWEK